jgi:hypothetical protein
VTSNSLKMSSLDEKAVAVESGHDVVDSEVDAAWKFLDAHRDAKVDPAHIKALRRKIDFHIVPIMFCCYFMQFLDKVILNVRSATPL